MYTFITPLSAIILLSLYTLLVKYRVLRILYPLRFENLQNPKSEKTMDSRFLQKASPSVALPATALPQNRFLAGFDTGRNLYNALLAGRALRDTSSWFKAQKTQTLSLRLFSLPQIWTCSPANIRAVLSTQFEDYEQSRDRIAAFKPYSGDGILSSNGETWKHGRHLIRPLFKRDNVVGEKGFAGFEQCFGDLEAWIRHLGCDGTEAVDLQTLFVRLTIDIVSDLVFGQRIGALTRPVGSASSLDGESQDGRADRGERVAQSIIYSSQVIATRLLMGPLVWAHHDSKAVQALETFEDYMDEKIDAGLIAHRQKQIDRESSSDESSTEAEEEEERVIFMREMMRSTTDKRELHDQLGSLMAAGTDTTATLLSFVFYNLVRHPRVMSKLREEIDQLQGELPDWPTLKRMTYLHQVMDESEFFERCEQHGTFTDCSLQLCGFSLLLP